MEKETLPEHFILLPGLSSKKGDTMNKKRLSEVMNFLSILIAILFATCGGFVLVVGLVMNGVLGSVVTYAGYGSVVGGILMMKPVFRDMK